MKAKTKKPEINR